MIPGIFPFRELHLEEERDRLLEIQQASRNPVSARALVPKTFSDRRAAFAPKSLWCRPLGFYLKKSVIGITFLSLERIQCILLLARMGNV